MLYYSEISKIRTHLSVYELMDNLKSIMNMLDKAVTSMLKE